MQQKHGARLCHRGFLLVQRIKTALDIWAAEAYRGLFRHARFNDSTIGSRQTKPDRKWKWKCVALSLWLDALPKHCAKPSFSRDGT